MPINSLNRKKLELAKKKNAQKFKEQVKKFKEQPSSSFKVEEEKKDNVLELYQNMSPKEKEIFNRELEKRKIRDNYALYIKYVYPNYMLSLKKWA